MSETTHTPEALSARLVLANARAVVSHSARPTGSVVRRARSDGLAETAERLTRGHFITVAILRLTKPSTADRHANPRMEAVVR